MLSPQILKSLSAKRKRIIIRFLSACFTAYKKVKGHCGIMLLYFYGAKVRLFFYAGNIIY